MRLPLLALLGCALLLGGCGVRMLRALPAPVESPKATAVSSGPVIQAFTANPGPVARPGQALTFQVVAHDASEGVLRYQWMTTGGTLSTDTGQLVAWHPPAEVGTYAVTVLVANGRGEASTAVLNVRVID